MSGCAWRAHATATRRSNPPTSWKCAPKPVGRSSASNLGARARRERGSGASKKAFRGAGEAGHK
eukprot:8722431-Alexandrium_andersonii.AAC.1